MKTEVALQLTSPAYNAIKMSVNYSVAFTLFRSSKQLKIIKSKNTYNNAKYFKEFK